MIIDSISIPTNLLIVSNNFLSMALPPYLVLSDNYMFCKELTPSLFSYSTTCNVIIDGLERLPSESNT